MTAYLRQNAAEVPQLFARRILNTIYDPDVHLTTVSRSDIFPEARWDENLVDKTPGAILFGVVGLFGHLPLLKLANHGYPRGNRHNCGCT